MIGIDVILIQLMGRFIAINIVPFLLVFHQVIRRRRQLRGERFSELNLVAGEIQIVGLLGYYVILSIFFYSIPVLKYLQTRPGYDIVLIEPDGFTVYLIAMISFSMVVASIYLKVKRLWAYRLLIVILCTLTVYSFFTILEFGLISAVPLIVFSYLAYRLTRPTLKKEFYDT